MYNVEEIRKDFPVLNMLVNGKPNTFLDSGASAQKPQVVIDRMVDIYTREYSNVHRGSYLLSEQITFEYEKPADGCQIFKCQKPAGNCFYP